MQIFYSPDHVRREPVLAAVGELQFDVVVSRLENEYGVKTTAERLPHVLARWIVGDPATIAAVYLALRYPAARRSARPRP